MVIVHGNQESNAMATVLWDNAFAEQVSNKEWGLSPGSIFIEGSIVSDS